MREKRPAPEGHRDDGEHRAKEARTEDDATMETLAGMVAEAVDFTGKALDTVSDAMRENYPQMFLEAFTPTTQQEARLSETKNIEKQESFEEVYLEDDMKSD